MIIILSILFIIVLIALVVHLNNRGIDVEEIEEVTHYNIKGYLQRHREGRQFYVVDPVDLSKTWVNSTDDMYEDAGGNIWRIKDDN